MTFDPSKLSPMPWKWDESEWFRRLLCGTSNQYVLWYTNDDDGIHCLPDDAELIVLARAAFDVMMRRGWHAAKTGQFWQIPMRLADNMISVHGANATIFKTYACKNHWSDPFTCLVESDAWYSENVEKQQ